MGDVVTIQLWCFVIVHWFRGSSVGWIIITLLHDSASVWNEIDLAQHFFSPPVHTSAPHQCRFMLKVVPWGKSVGNVWFQQEVSVTQNNLHDQTHDTRCHWADEWREWNVDWMEKVNSWVLIMNLMDRTDVLLHTVKCFNNLVQFHFNVWFKSETL